MLLSQHLIFTDTGCNQYFCLLQTESCVFRSPIPKMKRDTITLCDGITLSQDQGRRGLFDFVSEQWILTISVLLAVKSAPGSLVNIAFFDYYKILF